MKKEAAASAVVEQLREKEAVEAENAAAQAKIAENESLVGPHIILCPSVVLNPYIEDKLLLTPPMAPASYEWPQGPTNDQTSWFPVQPFLQADEAQLTEREREICPKHAAPVLLWTGALSVEPAKLVFCISA